MSKPILDRAAAALLRALKPVLGPYRLSEAESIAWASATFAGGRHVLIVELEGENAADRARAVTETIATIEFALPRFLVADIFAEAEGERLTIEALILEEC